MLWPTLSCTVRRKSTALWWCRLGCCIAFKRPRVQKSWAYDHVIICYVLEHFLDFTGSLSLCYFTSATILTGIMKIKQTSTFNLTIMLRCWLSIKRSCNFLMRLWHFIGGSLPCYSNKGKYLCDAAFYLLQKQYYGKKVFWRNIAKVIKGVYKF